MPSLLLRHQRRPSDQDGREVISRRWERRLPALYRFEEVRVLERRRIQLAARQLELLPLDRAGALVVRTPVRPLESRGLGRVGGAELQRRLIAEEHLRLWAVNPIIALDSSVEMQNRLTARLAKLEARVDETFDQAAEGALSAPDYENFYRMLGSFRGLSEAGIHYVRLAEKINWARWREARF